MPFRESSFNYQVTQAFVTPSEAGQFGRDMSHLFIFAISVWDQKKRTNMVGKHLKVSFKGIRLGMSFKNIIDPSYSLSLFSLSLSLHTPTHHVLAFLATKNTHPILKLPSKEYTFLTPEYMLLTNMLIFKIY